jgi:hypothetical protein
MRVAVCFWGICRSTEYTITSIKKHIYESLSSAGIEYDVYVHSFVLYRSYTNRRAGENTIHLKNTTWKLLKPKKNIIEDQDIVDKTLNFKEYRSQGNPWEGDIGNDFTTLDNHIRALYSLKRVTDLWSESGIEYDAILYCRPDVRYLEPIDPMWISCIPEKIILMPDFHLTEGCNDRFAIGKPDVMKVYGSRYTDALSFSRKNKLHSEKFLSSMLSMCYIKIQYIPFRFRRIRATGEVFPSDLSL